MINGARGHYPRLRLVELLGGEQQYLFASWSGGSGFHPLSGYLGETSGVVVREDAVNLRGITGRGTIGEDGWSPVMMIVSDGLARRVLRVSDWVGGAGTKPATGVYVGVSGFVALIGDAVDVRGAATGTSDITGPSSSINNNLSKWPGLTGNRIAEHSVAGVASLITKAGYLTVTSQKILSALVTAEAINTAKTTNATHTGHVTGATTLTIANDVVNDDMLATVGPDVTVTNASITVTEQGLIEVAETPVELTTGVIFGFAGATIPAGWLLCDGSAVSRATYSALFTTIGTTFGVGDGSTTFNLPDCRGRIAEGFNGTGLGSTKGSATHTLATTEIPDHTHTFNTYSLGVIYAFVFGTPTVCWTTTAGSTTGSAGGGDEHNNAQPTIIFNHIIKT